MGKQLLLHYRVLSFREMNRDPISTGYRASHYTSPNPLLRRAKWIRTVVSQSEKKTNTGTLSLLSSYSRLSKYQHKEVFEEHILAILVSLYYIYKWAKNKYIELAYAHLYTYKYTYGYMW